MEETGSSGIPESRQVVGCNGEAGPCSMGEANVVLPVRHRRGVGSSKGWDVDVDGVESNREEGSPRFDSRFQQATSIVVVVEDWRNGGSSQPGFGARASRSGRALQGDGDLRWRLACQKGMGEDWAGLMVEIHGPFRGSALRVDYCKHAPQVLWYPGTRGPSN